jgi:hypothetical protein
MFYSRPDLPKLGLDLVELEGGGSFPSQFWGKTTDGRTIFVRYRGGWLTVSSGPPGTNPYETRDVLVESCIGWPLHGFILKEQVCDLVGMTIGGERPILTQEAIRAAAERDEVRDWSGQTTYWVRGVLVTEEGGRRLTDELRAAFPSMHILETAFQSSRRRYIPRSSLLGIPIGATFGFNADQLRLVKMLASDHVALAELEDVFAHHLSFRFPWNDGLRVNRSYHERLAAKHGRNIEVPDGHLLGRLKTEFATNDPGGKAYIERLIETVEGCFSNWAEDIDLASGDTIGVRRMGNWYSNDLRDWCVAGPDRYLLCIAARDESKRDTGVRACNRPI